MLLISISRDLPAGRVAQSRFHDSTCHASGGSRLVPAAAGTVTRREPASRSCRVGAGLHESLTGRSCITRHVTTTPTQESQESSRFLPLQLQWRQDWFQAHKVRQVSVRVLSTALCQPLDTRESAKSSRCWACGYNAAIRRPSTSIRLSAVAQESVPASCAPLIDPRSPASE